MFSGNHKHRIMILKEEKKQRSCFLPGVKTEQHELGGEQKNDARLTEDGREPVLIEKKFPWQYGLPVF